LRDRGSCLLPCESCQSSFHLHPRLGSTSRCAPVKCRQLGRRILRCGHVQWHAWCALVVRASAPGSAPTGGIRRGALAAATVAVVLRQWQPYCCTSLWTRPSSRDRAGSASPGVSVSVTFTCIISHLHGLCQGFWRQNRGQLRPIMPRRQQKPGLCTKPGS